MADMGYDHRKYWDPWVEAWLCMTAMTTSTGIMAYRLTLLHLYKELELDRPLTLDDLASHQSAKESTAWPHGDAMISRVGLARVQKLLNIPEDVDCTWRDMLRCSTVWDAFCPDVDRSNPILFLHTLRERK